MRLLDASGAGCLSLTNLTLTNGFEQGTDGGSKGDGVYENGGDATAAIYSNIAALSLNRVVISNSRATGGEFGALAAPANTYNAGNASTVRIASGSARLSEVLFEGNISVGGGAQEAGNFIGGDGVAGVRNDATLYAQDVGFVNNTGTGADGGTSGFIEPSTASNGGDGVVGVHNFGALGA